MSDQPQSQPVRIFISGACAGLAEARDALSSHADIELVGTASEPSKAGSKLASTGAQVILHALQRPDHVPVDEIAKIREHTSAPIILLVTRTTPELLDEALSNGLNDILALPMLTEHLVFNVKKAHALGSMVAGSSAGGRRPGDKSRIVTLFSPKGGTGKTTLACNMAALFARKLRKRTLLIDLDLQFGDIAIVLGIEPKATLLDLVMSHGDLDADKLSGFATVHESGAHVLPAPMRPEDAELVTDDRLGSLLQAAKSAYDIVLIDTPPNFNSTVLTALDRTDELLVVASLDVPAVKSVKVCLQTLEMLHYPLDRCHIMLNRADSKVGITPDEVSKAVGKKTRFGIPSSRVVPISVNRGVPFVMQEPKAEITKRLLDVCMALTPEAEALDGGDIGAPSFKMSRKDKKRLKKQQQELAAAESAKEEKKNRKRRGKKSKNDDDADVSDDEALVTVGTQEELGEWEFSAEDGKPQEDEAAA